MNEALAQSDQVTSRKGLTHSCLWMKTLKLAHHNQQHTLWKECMLVWRRNHPDTDTGLWCPLLDTFCTDLDPLGAHFTTFSCTLPSSLTCTVCQLMLQHRWVGLEDGQNAEHNLKNDQNICFKDKLESFVKHISFLYIWMKVLVTFAYLKNNTSVCDMQVLCLWYYIHTTDITVLFKHIRQPFATLHHRYVFLVYLSTKTNAFFN